MSARTCKQCSVVPATTAAGYCEGCRGAAQAILQAQTEEERRVAWTAWRARRQPDGGVR